MSRFADDAKILCYRAPNAKDVAYGTEESRGPIDIEERLMPDAGGERLVLSTIITIPTPDLPALTRAVLPATIIVEKGTAAEQSYKVRDIQRVEDGELRELICAEV